MIQTPSVISEFWQTVLVILCALVVVAVMSWQIGCSSLNDRQKLQVGAVWGTVSLLVIYWPYFWSGFSFTF